MFFQTLFTMSKPSFEPIHSPNAQSFIFRRFGKEGFAAPLHYHPEYELAYVCHGDGRRFVGHNMMPFMAGDLVLVGANMPHCWKPQAIDQKLESFVIQFNQNFLGGDFLNCAEVAPLSKLLVRAAAGIHFHGQATKNIGLKIQSLFSMGDPFSRLLSFLQILHELAGVKEYTLLNTTQMSIAVTDSGYEKINRVYAYLVDHFQEPITLKEIAAIINMTPNAFCKYFKRMTRKTFLETLTDLRINYASQQLSQSDKQINSIGYESGFRDISHFYKMFQQRMKMSPMKYRKQFLN